MYGIERMNVVEKYKAAFIMKAATEGLTSKEVYNLSLVKFWLFVCDVNRSLALAYPKISDQDASVLQEMADALSNATRKDEYGIEPIYQIVSEVIEEEENNQEWLKEPLVEEEWEKEEREGEGRAYARMMAIAGWHHVPQLV